ncbi:MAG: hypothetical protein AAGJ93_16680, partial [Bacteroidota bacterium]
QYWVGLIPHIIISHADKTVVIAYLLNDVKIMKDQINTADEESFEFFEHGLKYDLDHLVEVFDEIPFWPIEKQAEYADLVCMRMAVDPFQAVHVESQIRETSDEGLNTTSIGNMAYVALNAPLESTRILAKRWLDAYRKHLESTTK